MADCINLNNLFIPNPNSTFIIECEGDSMVGAFIPPHAHLIIDRSLTAQPGDIVLAAVNGDFTVKRFMKEGTRCWLQPENAKYKPIHITDSVNIYIWGVVSSIIIHPKEAVPFNG